MQLCDDPVFRFEESPRAARPARRCHNPARASTTARRIPRAHAKSDSIARRGRRTRHRAGDNPDDDARESRRSHFDNDERARGIEEDARHDDGERVRESDDDENDG